MRGSGGLHTQHLTLKLHWIDRGSIGTIFFSNSGTFYLSDDEPVAVEATRLRHSRRYICVYAVHLGRSAFMVKQLRAYPGHGDMLDAVSHASFMAGSRLPPPPPPFALIECCTGQRWRVSFWCRVLQGCPAGAAPQRCTTRCCGGGRTWLRCAHTGIDPVSYTATAVLRWMRGATAAAGTGSDLLGWGC